MSDSAIEFVRRARQLKEDLEALVLRGYVIPVVSAEMVADGPCDEWDDFTEEWYGWAADGCDDE